MCHCVCSCFVFSLQPLVGQRVTLRNINNAPQLNGCAAIIRSPDAEDAKYLVEATTREGQQVPCQVNFYQMYQPPSEPSQAKLDARREFALKSSGRPVGMRCVISPHKVTMHHHDISWPSYINDAQSDFRPAPDTDGIVRYWGLNPQDPAARFTMARVNLIHYREFARHIYIRLPPRVVDGPGFDRKQEEGYGLPEEQWLLRLVHIHLRRLLAQRSARDPICARSFTLRVSLDRVSPSVFRTVRVPGAIALSTLVDKVLLPAMGWSRGYHDYCITDPRNGAMFGAKECTAVDTAFRPMHGYLFLNDDNVRLGDVLDSVGQRLLWVYDLGVRWEHTVEVVGVASTPLPSGQPHVFCLDGAGACPPEDGLGIDSQHPTLVHSRSKTVNDEPGTEIDWLFVGESGNDVYARSISAKGCLRDMRHPDFSRKQKEVVNTWIAAGNTSKDSFDPDLFSVDEVSIIAWFSLSYLSPELKCRCSLFCECAFHSICLQVNARLVDVLQTRKSDPRLAEINTLAISQLADGSIGPRVSDVDPAVVAPQPARKDPKALDLCAHCGTASETLKV
jgi:hypothetical protein